MREALSKLNERELKFVAAYAKLQAEAAAPCDDDLAIILGCTRKTIINRRNRVRAKGVPLMRFREPGWDFYRLGKRVSIDELNRTAERLRRQAAEFLKRADRAECHARELATAGASNA